MQFNNLVRAFQNFDINFYSYRAHNEVGAGRTSKRVQFTTEELGRLIL